MDFHILTALRIIGPSKLAILMTKHDTGSFKPFHWEGPMILRVVSFTGISEASNPWLQGRCIGAGLKPGDHDGAAANGICWAAPNGVTEYRDVLEVVEFVFWVGNASKISGGGKYFQLVFVEIVLLLIFWKLFLLPLGGEMIRFDEHVS